MNSVALLKCPFDSLTRVVFNLNNRGIVATQEEVARTCLVKVYMSDLMSVTEELVCATSAVLSSITCTVIAISRVI